MSVPVSTVRRVGLDRAAAQAAFADYLGDRSLAPARIRFVEMVVDQLTSRGVMKPAALYEASFTDLHAGGPDGLFAGRGNVVKGMFDALEPLHVDLDRVERAG